LQYAVDVLGSLIPLRLEQKLNLRSYQSLMTVEIAYIDRKDYGELVNGVGGWSHWVTYLLTNVANVLWNLMIIAIYLLFMLTVSWRLTALALVFLFAMSLALKYVSSGLLHRAGERVATASSRVNQVIMESITGMKTVRLALGEQQMTRSYSQALEIANSGQRHMAMIQAISVPLLSAAGGLFICALLLGNAVAHEGEPATWVSSILLFLFLLFRLMGPVSVVSAARSRVIGHMSAFDRLNGFYRETAAQRQPNGALLATPLQDDITFDHVTFGYKPDEAPAIQDLSITLKRGEMIALVGPSGAGKSTVIALLARLYDPQEGRILIGSIDLREFEVRSWRKRIAVVTQNNIIFNDTIVNNISFGRTDVSMESIQVAAHLAAATEFIEKLPEGYNAVLGDHGVRLSGGQAQRIAIARALLANPDLLILDEATSHLDTFTERAIQEAVEKMSKDRTLLVVAHRLSTIRKADKVIVMDGGRLVEEGRHDELLARRGAYWEMVEHQRLDLVDGDA
jgi:subfamily B ATP-binding cassette protein MsbA